MEFEIKNGQIGILLLKGKKRIFITYSKTYVIEGVSEPLASALSHDLVFTVSRFVTETNSLAETLTLALKINLTYFIRGRSHIT